MFFNAENQQKTILNFSLSQNNINNGTSNIKLNEILNLFKEANDSKFVTRKWNIVNDNSKSNCDTTNKVTYNIEILKSNLCDYSDAHCLVRCDISVVAALATQVAFKNCAPFTKCIKQFYETTIDVAEDLYLLMPMYNSIEYSSNYSETTGSLWFYSKDAATNFDVDIVHDDEFKSFKYSYLSNIAKLLRSTAAQPAPNAANRILNNAAMAVLLKYLSNFWGSLEIPVINSKVELKN